MRLRRDEWWPEADLRRGRWVLQKIGEPKTILTIRKGKQKGEPRTFTSANRAWQWLAKHASAEPEEAAIMATTKNSKDKGKSKANAKKSAKPKKKSTPKKKPPAKKKAGRKSKGKRVNIRVLEYETGKLLRSVSVGTIGAKYDDVIKTLQPIIAKLDGKD